jgi:hypothetical protein
MALQIRNQNEPNLQFISINQAFEWVDFIARYKLYMNF